MLKHVFKKIKKNNLLKFELRHGKKLGKNKEKQNLGLCPNFKSSEFKTFNFFVFETLRKLC